MKKGLKRKEENENIPIVVFRVTAPCSLVSGYQRFGETCCLHLQGEEK
jgi:hypothetical protein